MKKFLRAVKELRWVYKSSKNPDTIKVYFENSVEVNWIGEPYYTFNIPDEFFESEATLNSYVWKQMTDNYYIFQNLKIDQYLYPVTYIDHMNKTALIHMIVNKKPIKRFFKNLFFVSIASVIIYFLVQHFVK